jgi:hypothetical protein
LVAGPVTGGARGEEPGETAGEKDEFHTQKKTFPFPAVR